MTRRAPISSCIVVLALACGCSSDNGDKQPTTQPTTVRQRQDAALKDPFSYKPGMEDHDISGGDLGHFDREGMKRDIDNVFNP